MRPFPRLGAVNLTLLSIYFVPIWGREAINALVSPYSGFEDRTRTIAAIYLRRQFDLDLDGLIMACNLLAGTKLLVAAGFAAFAIEFARSLLKNRDVDRSTVDVVLALAVTGVVIWVLPVLALDDSALVRTHATQLLLVAGAVIVIVVERHLQAQRMQATAPAGAALPRAVASYPAAAPT
ncbi:MAG: hypothetical protein ACRECO_22150 [Xanthobacteraceae bacterium]